jgi:uncharacterized oxidoreductase
MNILANNLKRLLEEILLRSGSDDYEAEIVADHLIQANLRGHDSHGAYIIGYYMECLNKGAIKPNTSARLVSDQGTIMGFAGDRGYGQRIAREAMNAAIQRCKETGIVVMTLRNSGHLGRIGTYGEQASDAGFVSLHFANVIEFPPIVAPIGGRNPLFKTNPICFSMPGTDKTKPVIMDMATSSIAHGKAYVAMYKGHSLPENTVVDHEGRPTTEPKVLFEEPSGALLPFGGHKGYGLMVFCELLAGILSGGGTIQSFDDTTEGTFNNMLSLLIDPTRFVDQPWLQNALDDFVAYVKCCPPVDPDQPVLMPGDVERDVLALRENQGIPIDKASWKEILKAAEMVDMSHDEVEVAFV